MLYVPSLVKMQKKKGVGEGRLDTSVFTVVFSGW